MNYRSLGSRGDELGTEVSQQERSGESGKKTVGFHTRFSYRNDQTAVAVRGFGMDTAQSMFADL
jgi:hypothetical protein